MMWSRLRLICLFLLSENKELTGYSIAKITNSSHQQAYRELIALENDGLVISRIVASRTKPDSKFFTLTLKGHQYISEYDDHFPALEVVAKLPAEKIYEVCLVLPINIRIDYLADVSSALSNKVYEINKEITGKTSNIVSLGKFNAHCHRRLATIIEKYVEELKEVARSA